MADIPNLAAHSLTARRWWGAILAGYGAGVIAVFVLLYHHLRHPQASGLGWAGWDLDAAPFVAWLLLAPLLAWLRWKHAGPEGGSPKVIAPSLKNRVDSENRSENDAPTSANAPSPQSGLGRWRTIETSRLAPWLIFALALGVNVRVGTEFHHWPPAYHDEYSYLIQAETFLRGRLWNETAAEPRLFDQVHVLNTDKFVSRYFPGTGLWMLPFLALGAPYLGHWLAGAGAAAMSQAVAARLAGPRVGWAAGVLVALSPGMVLFSNLLLAHQPTMFALSVFLHAFVRILERPRMGWGLCAGAALGFAAICRPMTAAGFALPWGAYWIWTLCRSSVDASETWWRRLAATLGLGLPLLVCGAGLFAYNRAITGSGWLSPYQQYTDLYTPRHVYGFDNVRRAERAPRGEVARVHDQYDRWAENLTPSLAARNVGRRWLASLRWTLGLVPLWMALAAGLALWRHMNIGLRLILASIISLHAVHIPYWFSGIMEWHYVFETGPLWLIWLAGTTGVVLSRAGRAARLVGAIWCGIVLTAVVVNWVSTPLWGDSRVARGVVELQFPRAHYGYFRALVEQASGGRPVLVLVEPGPGDLHLDYVTNPADLQSSRVLVGRYLPDQIPLARVRAAHPQRQLFLFRPADRQLIPLTPPPTTLNVNF